MKLREWEGWTVIKHGETPGEGSEGIRIFPNEYGAVCFLRGLDAGAYRNGYRVVKVKITEILENETK